MQNIIHCPVCGRILKSEKICSDCGYDLTRDYEIYPTLEPIQGNTASVSAKRMEYVRKAKRTHITEDKEAGHRKNSIPILIPIIIAGIALVFLLTTLINLRQKLNKNAEEKNQDTESAEVVDTGDRKETDQDTNVAELVDTERDKEVSKGEGVEISESTKNQSTESPVLKSHLRDLFCQLSGTSSGDEDDLIKAILFTDESAPEDIKTVNLSETGEEVTAWFDKGSGTIYIKASADKVLLNEDASYTFSELTKLEELDLSRIDTSSVTDINGMFFKCSSLKDLDLSGFDTSSVTEMADLFYMCSSLKSLDLSGFDTSSVSSMSYMFYECSSLTDLDLSGFDTSSVKGMGLMFYNCNSLTNLNLSGFDTSSVTTMAYMFRSCSSLKDLDLSGFDTASVSDMTGMFHSCKSLERLDLSGFDTSGIGSDFISSETGLEDIFYDCDNLTDLVTKDETILEAYENR